MKIVTATFIFKGNPSEAQMHVFTNDIEELACETAGRLSDDTYEVTIAESETM